VRQTAETAGESWPVSGIVLRIFQRVIVDETDWMLGELETFGQEGERQAMMLEARELISGLQRAARGFLDDHVEHFEIALKQHAEYSAEVDQSTPATIELIKNGLHAAIRPINDLIERLGETLEEQRLGMLLRTGMVPCLQAIDGIGAYLDSSLPAVAISREGDFGTFGPATD
jgi:hypothetical protein